MLAGAAQLITNRLRVSSPPVPLMLSPKHWIITFMGAAHRPSRTSLVLAFANIAIQGVVGSIQTHDVSVSGITGPCCMPAAPRKGLWDWR